MILGVLITAFSVAAPMSMATPTAHGWVYNVNHAGVAFDGFDVMGFHEGVSEHGEATIFADIEGVRYLFRSTERRERFLADPERYQPVCGGWDAVMCGVDPERAGFAANRWRPSHGTFRIHAGRLLLLSDRPQWNTLAAFEASEEPDAVVQRADVFWAERIELVEDIGVLPEGMNPAARLELVQWAPLMGTWRCEAFGKTPDGEWRSSGRADWTFKFGYEGYVIEDHWKPHVNPTASGPAFRIYDPLAKEWGMVFMPSVGPSNAWWLMTGTWVGSELHGEYRAQEGRVQGTLRFYEIEEGSFRWISDRSVDGGETWVEEVAKTECSRLAG